MGKCLSKGPSVSDLCKRKTVALPGRRSVERLFWARDAHSKRQRLNGLNKAKRFEQFELLERLEPAVVLEP
jgi:hypothetical protein